MKALHAVVLLLSVIACTIGYSCASLSFPVSYLSTGAVDISGGLDPESFTIAAAEDSNFWVIAENSLLHFNSSGNHTYTDFPAETQLDYIAYTSGHVFVLDKAKRVVFCVSESDEKYIEGTIEKDEVILGVAANPRFIFLLYNNYFSIINSAITTKKEEDDFEIQVIDASEIGTNEKNLFSNPVSIFAGESEVYIRVKNNTIVKFAENGTFLGSWKTMQGSVALSEDDGYLLVANPSTGFVNAYSTTDGALLSGFQLSNNSHVDNIVVGGDVLYVHSYGEKMLQQYCWQPHFDVAITVPTCFGSVDGIVKIEPHNYDTDFNTTYKWFNSTFSATGTGLELKDLPTGDLILEAQAEGRGCPRRVTIPFKQPDELVLESPEEYLVECVNNDDVTLVASGGTLPYKYTITGLIDKKSSTSTDGKFETKGLVGNYSVTVEDAQKCVLLQEQFIYINVTDTPPVTVRALDATCNGVSNGMVNLSIETNSKTLKYNWTLSGKDMGNNNPNYGDVAAGTYTITIIDTTTLCMWLPVTAVVKQPEPLKVGTILTPETSKGGDGIVTVVVTGGTPPYTCTLGANVKNGTTLFTFENLTNSQMELIVQDFAGCKEHKQTIDLKDPVEPITYYYGIPAGSVVGVAFGVAGFFLIVGGILAYLIKKGKLKGVLPAFYQRRYGRVPSVTTREPTSPMKETVSEQHFEIGEDSSSTKYRERPTKVNMD